MTTTAVKERPILFRAPMVRAILEGRKTQTRRLVKPNPELAGTGHYKGWTSDRTDHWIRLNPYGKPGDKLWVRETWATHPDGDGVLYRATDPGWDDNDTGLRWKPAIHMFRESCRLVLEIVRVRVERLQEITEGDAIAEGFMFAGHGDDWMRSDSFLKSWDSHNAAPFDWASNPWVFVIDFKRLIG